MRIGFRQRGKTVQAVLICLLGASLLNAEEIPQEQLAFFEAKIRPVLVDACYECHSKEAGKSKGGLNVDSKVGLELGGGSGQGIVPFKPDESVLMDAILWRDKDLEMPPEQKLPANVIEDFRKWIEMGAPDPRGGQVQAVETEIDIEAGRQFWSFQKPRKSEPPRVSVTEWGKADVDRFVYAKLKEKGMAPAGLAKPGDLVRRLSYDLVGLPPTVEYVNWFEGAWKANPEKAVATLVDKLMATPQFGERWGRHWLDVARFAESAGKLINQAFPEAWRYRDYVIDSFNKDKPYNRFIAEQLAGDLLNLKTPEERQEAFIATAFLAVGPKDLILKSRQQLEMEIIDDQINATMLAFQGLTVTCARCHDHKTDPIPTADYYSLAGIFLSSNTHYSTSNLKGRSKAELAVLPMQSSQRKTIPAEEIEEKKKRLAEINTALRAFKTGKKDRQKEENRDPDIPVSRQKNPRNLRVEKMKIEKLLESMESGGVVREMAMAVLEGPEPVEANILVLGELDSPAQKVPRGFLQVMDHYPKKVPEGQSGRLQLAQWIASPDNPLTARVAVNRVWAKLFGQGLVQSTENFGATGRPPTHPELLDHLAVQFMEEGWSVKQLIRKLVRTRAYQMSTGFNQANYDRDPENEFLWRATPKRLDGEALRDSILAVSGQLDFERPYGSAVRDFGVGELGKRSSPNLNANSPPIRSVYLPAVRDKGDELVGEFDGADSNKVVGQRDATNVAGQGLYMLNNAFVLQQAEAFAKVLHQYTDPKQKLEQAFLRAFGRLPTKGEHRAAGTFYNQFHPTALKENGSQAEAEKQFWTAFCQGLFCSAEFRYLN